MNSTSALSPSLLAQEIKQTAKELGLSACAITDTDLQEAETHLLNWLNAGFHGEMHYMERHGTKRSRPDSLEPGTIRIVSVRLDYGRKDMSEAHDVLQNPELGYVSRYALGRDYHKVLRKRLQQLADFIKTRAGEFGYRAFVDSAPVLEKALAEKAGLGWIGKHSNLLNESAGSWFFLGELYTNLDIAVDPPQANNHCGSCTACIDACPTQAIVAPFKVDARRCISYHTIELRSSIPLEFRKSMGNRIYGCDDCQLVCPFNKFSSDTTEKDFAPRHGLDAPSLIGLFEWTEDEFKQRFEGSPIRRIGYDCWMRNIAVALGNAPTSEALLRALKNRINHPSVLVREHVLWALEQHSQMPVTQ